MLVWNAMLSITRMMSAILREDSLMPFLVCTTWLTTSPPLMATTLALSAIWLPWRALSAFCFTVLVSSSIDAAVSPSALDCRSVRLEKSLLPCAISDDAAAILCALSRTLPTIPSRLDCMTESASSKRVFSSLP